MYCLVIRYIQVSILHGFQNQTKGFRKICISPFHRTMCGRITLHYGCTPCVPSSGLSAVMKHMSYFPAYGTVKWRDTDFPKPLSLVLRTMQNRCLYISDDKTIHCGPCFHFCQLFYLMALKFCEMERSSVVVLLQLDAARGTLDRQEGALGHLQAARCQE